VTPSSKASNHNRYYRPLHMFKSVRFSFLSVWHAKVVHSSFPQPFCLKPTCAHCNSHASMNVEITRRRALTTGSQAHAQRSLNSTYDSRIDSILGGKSAARCGYRRTDMEQLVDTSHGTCCKRLPSLLFARKLVSDIHFSYHSDRFQRSVQQRLTRSEPSRIEFSRFVLQTGYNVPCLLHQRQHPMPHITHRMEQSALVCALERALSWRIAQRMPVFVGYVRHWVLRIQTWLVQPSRSTTKR
jgi:hypothetical protein